MTRKILTLFPALLLSAVTGFSQNGLIQKIADNLKAITMQEKVDTPELKEDFIETSENGRYNDVMILQLFTEVNIPDDEIRRWIDTQRPDGSWPDIDYGDRKRSRWEPAYQATRIQAMTKVYDSKTSSLHRSPALAEAIHNAMGFWFDAGLKCPNWWYNQIGVPKMMAPAFLLFWDEMSADERADAIKVLDNARFGMTGQNKVWLAGIVLIKGVLTQDEALIKEARDQIASEIFMSTKEGLQPDWSFHQHGAMMQFGNYGLAYIGSMAYWARVFEGTELAFTPEQIDMLRNYMNEGIMWCIWRGYFDPSASGRQVFLNSQKGKGYSVAVSALNMMSVDKAHENLYRDFLARNVFDTGKANDLNGTKYYYRSDYGVHRTPDWFASVRMHSDRTLGYEIGNGENLKGFYSADGTTIIMTRGGEYDNIYPIWDWRHLPGTTVTITDASSLSTPATAMMSVSAHKSAMNRSLFVGGVSDGKDGCMVMELDRDSLKAKKAYFFIDDHLICLGNSIRSSRSGASVHTTLDQAHLRGEVLRGKGKGRGWVHHDGKGYVVFEPNDRLNVTTDKQTGDWHDIAVMYEDMPREGEVFKAYIDHGTDEGRYAYAVLPGANESRTAAYAKAPRCSIIANTPECQAVANRDGRQVMAVFHAPGVVQLPDMKDADCGWVKGRTLKADKPCLIMVSFDGNGQLTDYAVSSPLKDVARLEFSYTRRWKGDNREVADFSIDLPTSPAELGATVKGE